MNYKKIDSLGTISRVIYKGDFKKTYLYNEKNKTNFYTIIKEVLVNECYLLKSKLEIGEKFISYFQYDELKNIKYERRFNKVKKTTFKQELLIKNDNGYIYVNEYKNEKNIKINLNNLKNGK